MFFRLILLFALLPLIELYLLIKVGSVIGGLPTIGLVLFTGVLGAYLARLEGTRVFLRAQENMKQGIPPAEEVIDALLIFIAGVVLLTPGIVTDCMGFAMLFPPTRRLFKVWLRKRFDQAVANGTIHTYPPGSGPFGSTANSDMDIDVDFTNAPPRPPSAPLNLDDRR